MASGYGTAQFLFTLTVIQFWWIAVWGIAYIVIGFIAGPSKSVELVLYASMLVFTVVVIQSNPELIRML